MVIGNYYLEVQVEYSSSYKKQKQPSVGVLGEMYSENMQQIYWRTPMPKCDFNKLY